MVVLYIIKRYLFNIFLSCAPASQATVQKNKGKKLLSPS